MSDNHPSILVVDDNERVRDDIRAHAEKQFPNHTIVEADNLKDAMAHLDKHNIAGAIIDGSFPTEGPISRMAPDQYSGPKLAKKLQEKNIPRVMFSGEDVAGSYGHTIRETKTPFISKEGEGAAEKAVGILKSYMAKAAKILKEGHIKF